ncbi:MAG: DUF1697 domain-containing protein [Deltaproteobacteria bacterium]|nr:DUF1697 domain-containing protein [Deltaproteobacteria bacterium]
MTIAPGTAASHRTIALLRGINVGGKNKLPMAELRAVCEELGFRDVKTYIASGNLFFTSDMSPAEDGIRLKTAIAERWGYDVPVVTRLREDVLAVRDGNPFGVPAEDRWLHVLFLNRDPQLGPQGLMDPAGVAAVRGLDPEREPGDRFAVVGRHIYALYANGSGRSRLTGSWLERQLKVTATARNWRTVQKLIALSE